MVVDQTLVDGGRLLSSSINHQKLNNKINK